MASKKLEDFSTPCLSERVSMLTEWEDFLLKYMMICYDNEYDHDLNKDGYINLGTAVNNMCNDILIPKLTDSSVWRCDTTLLQYKDSHGIFELRDALAKFMTHFFKPHHPISPDSLFCSVGVTSSIDLIAHCLANPGDVIMAPTPVYGRIYTDMMQRSQVDMWPIPIITQDNTEDQEQLTLEKVKAAFEKAKQQGKNVKGILLINPSNPLGDVYSPELVKEILEFCNEVGIHVIIDEIYALSLHDDDSGFQSVLSFGNLPNPSSTHVLYGMSKDHCVAGLRIGAIHTKNPELQKCLIQLTMFHVIPFPVMAVAAKLLSDLDFWQHFKLTNQQRLCEKFNYCKTRLKNFGISVRDSRAAFFVWVDLKKKCGLHTFEDERAFFNFLMEKHHLYVVPGKELFCLQPGCFRLCFSANFDHVAVGLDRFEKAIEEYSKSAHCFDSIENIVIESIQSNASTSDTTGHENASTSKYEAEESLESLVLLLRKQIVDSDLLIQSKNIDIS